MHQHLSILRCQPKYVHRSSCKKFARSYRPNNIDSIWSWSRNNTNVLERSVDFNNLHTVAFTECPVSRGSINSTMPSFALLNVQSLNNKGPFINDVITDMNLDCMCLTETWQAPNEYITLNEATPRSYTFVDKPRLSGWGGRFWLLYAVLVLRLCMCPYRILHLLSV